MLSLLSRAGQLSSAHCPRLAHLDLLAARGRRLVVFHSGVPRKGVQAGRKGHSRHHTLLLVLHRQAAAVSSSQQ